MRTGETYKTVEQTPNKYPIYQRYHQRNYQIHYKQLLQKDTKNNREAATRVIQPEMVKYAGKKVCKYVQNNLYVFSIRIFYCVRPVSIYKVILKQLLF